MSRRRALMGALTDNILYDRGNEHVNITGGYSPQPLHTMGDKDHYPSYDGNTYGSWTMFDHVTPDGIAGSITAVEKKGDGLYFEIISNNPGGFISGLRSLFTNKKFDFSKYNHLKVSYSFESDSSPSTALRPFYIVFSSEVIPAQIEPNTISYKDTTMETIQSKKLLSTELDTIEDFDISDILGKKYFAVFLNKYDNNPRFEKNTGIKLTINKMWLE